MYGHPAAGPRATSRRAPAGLRPAEGVFMHVERTLTKAELAELLYEGVGLSKREAKGIGDTFYEDISEALARGTGGKLSGCGYFQVRDRPRRPGRNPRAGEVIPTAARRRGTFHASQRLKSVVEQAGH